ncbi:MAG: CPBP family intramembrane metalloprotease [Acidobacteriota bacterium]|nr:CPBP family intramembrane metalloprotease [Acidobacteriota bacterium]
MQVIAPKQKIEHQPEPVIARAAQLSLSAVAGLEVASVLSSVFITTWVIIPLQPQQRWLIAVPSLLAFVLIVNSHRLRGEGLREIGFTLLNFGRALKLVAPPTILVCIACAALGYFTDSFHLTSHFWTNLLFLPVWGLTQQYVLQGFIYRRIRFVLMDDTTLPSKQGRRVNFAILATAAIFALAHAPNLMLMFLTLLGALLWSWIYERAPNLWALGLSHAVISLTLMTSLPSWLLPSLSVGYKHFLYQKF